METKKQLIDANALLDVLQQRKKEFLGAWSEYNAIPYSVKVMIAELTEIMLKIDEAPTAKAVLLDDVYRVIAGHSDYHGDNILSALTCISEGKSVNPVRPLNNIARVVRCGDCKWATTFGDFNDGWVRCTNIHGKPLFSDSDFCSLGERRIDNEEG